MWKEPKNPVVAELSKTVTERIYNLSCLVPVKSEELNAKGKPRRFCAWCVDGELFKSNAKYCTKECSSSAMAWAYPQKEDALKIHLFNQGYKCIGCEFDYKPFLNAMVAKENGKWGGSMTIETLFWYHFKRLKRQVPKDRKPEIDHIVSIAMGGQSLGISNARCLCYLCHKAKTKQDAKDRAIKNKANKA